MDISHTISSLRSRYSQSNSAALRNPWVLGWIAMVCVFLAVNALFVVLAVASNPGLVVEDYYEQGQQYEKHALKLLAARNALKWETNLEVPRSVRVAQADVYRFSAVDARGLPIRDAQVKLLAYRPSDAAADFVSQLEQIGPGLYQARISFPLPGAWDLNVKVRHGDDDYETSHRIAVKAP